MKLLEIQVPLCCNCSSWPHVLLAVNGRSKVRNLCQVLVIYLLGTPCSTKGCRELHPAFALEEQFIILLYFV